MVESPICTIVPVAIGAARKTAPNPEIRRRRNAPAHADAGCPLARRGKSAPVRLDIPTWRCYYNNAYSVWVWRSLVACLNGVQEAGSSNLLTQTSEKS